jgi:putative ABC transport system substrate-binding protein
MGVQRPETAASSGAAWCMRRRELMQGACTLAAAWPIAARAQPAALPRIGYLANASPAGFSQFVTAFRLGLAEAGYVEGRNVAIEFRWTDGQSERLAELAADFVRLKVAVIVATGGSAPARVAKAATTSIPIVFTGGGDPVRQGLVASLGRPGGNATGVLNFSVDLTAKRLQLLRELVPGARWSAALMNRHNPDAEAQVREVEDAARTTGLSVRRYDAGSDDELQRTFDTMAKAGAGALIVGADPCFTSRRTQVVALAARHALPAIYPFREFVQAGGLLSYGVDLPEVHRQSGVYAGRILGGARPAQLPVLQPTKFVLSINARTAATLGLKVPARILGSADEVID